MATQNSTKDSPCIRSALLKTNEGEKFRCLTCEQRCLLAEDQMGLCKTRQVINGNLRTLVYGNISSISNNPIEKKPFYHFHPGSFALTIGTYSCNFTCPWCQNYDISKVAPHVEDCNYISPEKLISLALQAKSQGLSYSFNEPTLMLEHALDTFPLARQKGLYNTFVTNGYMTLEALDLLIESGLDAMNVDIKGDRKAVRKYCGADVDKVYRNCTRAIEQGVHVEITTLIIPGVNDDEMVLREIASRIKTEIGPAIPWHLSRYHPQYEFTAPHTPIKTLERARAIGSSMGLDYVYLGNVPGKGENTYCPKCNATIIKRYIFEIDEQNLDSSNKCRKCGNLIPIRR